VGRSASARRSPARPPSGSSDGGPPTLLRITDQAHIRNFSIIAHIDHGKSTLADRILELTHTVDPRAMRAQLLDSMDLERERGITIKAQAVRVFYTSSRDGEVYQLQLIDTPGHVDFTYEVSRSLAACEGALLVVDASQGVEAQTVANTYLAIEAGLELIPCLNKLDLPGAEPERVASEISELIGEPPDDVRRISAKTGEGVTEVLDELIARVPPPSGDPDAAPRALIFDSEFDQYRGVIAYIRVVDGTFKKGDAISAMAAGTDAEIDDIGFFNPKMTSVPQLGPGEVGFLITGLKDVTTLRVGDTLTSTKNPARKALPGYRDVKPMVFCGLFPIDTDQYPDMRDALEKLTLNDAALTWEPETSDALGFGFRCGFLGLLHMDIVRERLEREYGLDLMATMPSVEYEVTKTDGSVINVHSPADMPEPQRVKEVREPFIRASILTPKEYVGQIMELCQEKRGEHVGMHYLSAERLQLTYDLPLAEIVLDFFDQLKSRTRGYASLDYELTDLRESDLVKLDILLASEPVDALSMLVHRSKAEAFGRSLAEKLRKKIPRQQYDVPIQAAIGSRIVARETIKAYRKDVIAGCYGGDISRKRKLLEQQKKGKKRMKQVGKIEVPQEAFLAVLELGDAD
jgi:GTP-binding protein LepA